MTINKLFDKFCILNQKETPTDWDKESKRYFEKEISPAFGDTDIISLTPSKIRAWHESYHKKPYAGNRALAVLSRLYSFAEEREIVPFGHNPCRIVKHFSEKKRSKYPGPEELVKICSILREDYPKKKLPVTFLFLLLYTGARPSVFVNAKRKDLKLMTFGQDIVGVLQQPGKSSSRSGQDEKVVIPPQGMKLIDALSTERLDGKLVGQSIPHGYWKTVVERAGCPDLWIRDFRRAFASVGISNGMSIDVVGELLNHKSANTTKIYGKLFDNKRVESVISISKNIDGLLAAVPAPAH